MRINVRAACMCLQCDLGASLAMLLFIFEFRKWHVIDRLDVNFTQKILMADAVQFALIHAVLSLASLCLAARACLSRANWLDHTKTGYVPATKVFAAPFVGCVEELDEFYYEISLRYKLGSGHCYVTPEWNTTTIAHDNQFELGRARFCWIEPATGERSICQSL